MTSLQITSRQVAAHRNADSFSTMILVAVANVIHPERGTEIVKRLSGQNLVELFLELDHPDSEKDLVGILLAVPPQLNGSPQWVAETVVDFAQVKLRTPVEPCVDTFAYRLASNEVFRDNEKIDPADVLCWRSLYEVCTPDGPEAVELLAHQTWLSVVVARLVNAVNSPDASGDIE
ncbi:hypothetical protein [Pseudomonas sp. OV226]|uniref:hypothetical protein n=1 Tax=Pseudomonas sp. OV226 TaxID=2135588 RepID=UPI002113C2ED|nr:hypothetical protein [Pseudomonas sp. OV226]